MPTDGAKAFRPICLDRKQLGLVSENGPIMDRQKMRKKGSRLRKPRICLIIVLPYQVTSRLGIYIVSKSHYLICLEVARVQWQWVERVVYCKS